VVTRLPSSNRASASTVAPVQTEAILSARPANRRTWRTSSMSRAAA
jgi:hypothetical protein